jgi:hypothetical protein
MENYGMDGVMDVEQNKCGNVKEEPMVTKKKACTSVAMACCTTTVCFVACGSDPPCLSCLFVVPSFK